MKLTAATAGHMAIILAAVVPGAMATSVRAVYLVSVVSLDPFIVGSFNYAASFLAILFVYCAARGRIDRVDPVRLTVLSLTLAISSTVCVLAAAYSPLFLIAATLFGAGASIGGSSIFLYDERYGPRGDDNAGLFRTRLLMSVAWIVGPPLSYVVFCLAGFAAVTAVTAAMALFAALGMVFVSRSHPPLPKIEAPPRPREGAGITTLGSGRSSS